MFEKVLRAFETRGITYGDVLARLRRLLATGASAQELLAILRRRESAERMPEFARVEAFLIEAVELEHNAAEESGAKPGEVAVDVEFDAAGGALDPPAGLRASELDLSVLARHLRSIEERKPARGASLEALTRSYERAREGEAAAAERAASLAADLEAAAAALSAEQSKVREVEESLTQRVASAESAREAAVEELQRYRDELRSLREALAERDTAFDQARQALADQDARIDALSRERTVLETELEARARDAADLEAELRAAHARADAAPPHREESRAQSPAPLTPPPSPLPPASVPAPISATRAPASTAPAPARAPEPAPAPGPAPGPAPARRPSPSIAGRGRVIGWGAAALLLVALVGWFMQRSPSRPAPPPAAQVPNPGSVIRDCPGCPAMTVLPPGRFKQGAAGGPAYEQPLHWVVIARPIAMSTNPVTLADFEQFARATGRDMKGCDTYDGQWQHRAGDSWEHPGFVQSSGHPVTCVSWNDAQAYAGWLSAKTGHRYRLPSASEWEYAARAGTGASQPWGSDGRAACAEANVADASAGQRYPGWAVFPCDDGYVYTAPVGTFKASAFGLNDMLGNVLEWTADCWHENYTGAPVDGSAWMDGDCSAHETRGGSWFSTPAYVRADYRDRFPADYRTSTVGMRLVRELGP